MSSSDTITYRGETVEFTTEETGPFDNACSGCLGNVHDDVCDDLPDDCRTHRVRFVRAA